MSADFYAALEARFRGSLEQIHQRLSQYDGVLDRLERTTSRRAVDLGCGRGEWLQKLDARGWSVVGVDADAGMASLSDLPIQVGDLISWLVAAPSDSVDLLTAFHVVEHLDYEQLMQFAQHAQRVLTDSGVLLIETPNPENLRVASESFYLDPTHKRPLPPEFLEFLFEYVGFERARAVRINSPLPYPALGHLGQAFESYLTYSPDFALLAGSAEVADECADYLGGDMGRSDPRFVEHLEHVGTRAEQGWSQLQEVRQQVVMLEQAVVALEQANAQRVGARLARVRSLCAGVFRRHSVQSLMGALVRKVVPQVMARPHLRRVASRILSLSPRFDRWVTQRVKSTLPAHQTVPERGVPELFSQSEQRLYQQVIEGRE